MRAPRSPNRLAPAPATALAGASLLFMALAFGPAAHALPVVEHLDLQVGGERFLKVPPDPSVRIDPPDLITFEALPPREAFVVAKKPGRGLLFVASGTQNIFQVVTVRVHAPGEPLPRHQHTPAELAAAQRACPSLVLQATRHGQELEAEVKTLECRGALLALLRDDAFLRRNVAFSFTGELLRQQIVIIEKRLAEAGLGDSFQLFYRGATLVIRGRATPEQRLTLYRIAWEETLGSFLFEDQSERLPAPVAKSTKEPPSPAAAAQIIRVQTIEEMQKEHPELFEKSNPESAQEKKNQTR